MAASEEMRVFDFAQEIDAAERIEALETEVERLSELVTILMMRMK